MCWSRWVPHTVVERSRDPRLVRLHSFKVFFHDNENEDQRKQRNSITGGIKGSLKLEIPAFPLVLEAF